MMKILASFLFVFLIMGCASRKPSDNTVNDMNVQRITVQEFISGVEGGGSSFRFEITATPIKVEDSPISMIFNGKEAKLIYVNSKELFSASIHFSPEERKELSTAFRLDRCVLVSSKGKNQEVSNIQILESEYQP